MPALAQPGGYFAFADDGGLAALLLLSLTPRGHDPFLWCELIAWYGTAKLAEVGDIFVGNATREVFAGHVLKHLAAAAGGLAIASALLRPTGGMRGVAR